MAKAKVTKKAAAKKAAPRAKKVAAEKPKTMAARRPQTQPTRQVGEVFRTIVSTILNTRTKTFTSTYIADAACASQRHSRRTLAALADQRVLTVQRGTAPYVYRVSARARLRQLAQ